jgi:putative membrane protein
MANKYEEEPHMLDPDVRFLLANERTLLAWVRTGLTLQAGGIALTMLHKTSNGTIVGIGVLLLGAIVAIMGYFRFRAADRAIREHRLPDTGHGPLFQVIGVVIFGVILAGIQLASI